MCSQRNKSKRHIITTLRHDSTKKSNLLLFGNRYFVLVSASSKSNSSRWNVEYYRRNVFPNKFRRCETVIVVVPASSYECVQCNVIRSDTGWRYRTVTATCCGKHVSRVGKKNDNCHVVIVCKHKNLDC